MIDICAADDWTTEMRPTPPPPLPTSLPSGHFEFDESTLTVGTRAELDRIAVFMEKNPDVMVEIQGHTDSVGTEAYNQALGQRRADEVFEYLSLKGINPSRLKTVSFGETRPVASNSTAEGRARNRRVDLVPTK
jgi:OmpA-OmpF porin, OOP family